MQLFFRYIWSTHMLSLGRTIALILFVSLITCLFSLILTLHNALELKTEDSESETLMVVNKSSPFMYLPHHYIEEIEQIKEVEDTAHVTWVGGYFRNPSWRLPVFAISEDYFTFDNKMSIDESSYENWRTDELGLVLNQSYAEKYQISIGDPFPINDTVWQLPENALTHLRVRAFVNVEGSDFGVYLHYSLINKLRSAKNLVSYVYVKNIDGSDIFQLGKNIDKLFANNLHEGVTKTASPQGHMVAFSRQFFQLGKMLLWIGIVIVIAFINILAVNYYLIAKRSERDYSVLNVIGFGKLSAIFLLFAKLILLSILGGVSGLVLAQLIIKFINHSFNHLLPVLSFEPLFYLYTSGGLLFVSAIASLPAMLVVSRTKNINRQVLA